MGEEHLSVAAHTVKDEASVADVDGVSILERGHRIDGLPIHHRSIHRGVIKDGKLMGRCGVGAMGNLGVQPGHPVVIHSDVAIIEAPNRCAGRIAQEPGAPAQLAALCREHGNGRAAARCKVHGGGSSRGCLDEAGREAALVVGILLLVGLPQILDSVGFAPGFPEAPGSWPLPQQEQGCRAHQKTDRTCTEDQNQFICHSLLLPFRAIASILAAQLNDNKQIFGPIRDN